MTTRWKRITVAGLLSHANVRLSSCVVATSRRGWMAGEDQPVVFEQAYGRTAKDENRLLSRQAPFVPEHHNAGVVLGVEPILKDTPDPLAYGRRNPRAAVDSRGELK